MSEEAKAKVVASSLGFDGKDITRWLKEVGKKDPNKLRAFMEMMTLPEESNELKGAIARATAQKNKPGPKGRRTRNNIFTAANPLEHLASGIEGYQGATKLRDAEARQAEIQQLRRDSMGTLQEGIMGDVAAEAPAVVPDTEDVYATPIPEQPVDPAMTALPDDSQTQAAAAAQNPEFQKMLAEFLRKESAGFSTPGGPTGGGGW